MPFYNLKGGRELSTHKSTAYKKQVIKYLQAFNYILKTDSDHHGTTSDLVFNRPYVDGDKETHVEVKDTKLSLSDKEFLTEMAKYYCLYLAKPQGFFMLIFLRECSNKTKWEHLFDETKQKDEEIQKLRDSILANAQQGIAQKLKESSYDNFLQFFKDISTIKQDMRIYLEKPKEGKRSNTSI